MTLFLADVREKPQFFDATLFKESIDALQYRWNKRINHDYVEMCHNNVYTQYSMCLVIHFELAK